MSGLARTCVFEPVFAELNRRAATLFIHPSGLGLCSPLLSEHGLTWPIGAAFEDTMFVAHAIRRRIPLRYANIKIVAGLAKEDVDLILDRTAARLLGIGG